MTWLSLLLLTKIIVTAALVAVPFLALPVQRLTPLTGGNASSPALYRLYGVATIALLTVYGFGILGAEMGVMPWGTVLAGIVSNLGASIVLVSTGTSNKMRAPSLFFGGIAALLMLSTLAPDVALTRAW